MTERCRSCGAEIEWATSETGRTVPLNLKTEKRFVRQLGGRVGLVDTWTSHFATCPDANKWRKGGAA